MVRSVMKDKSRCIRKRKEKSIDPKLKQILELLQQTANQSEVASEGPVVDDVDEARAERDRVTEVIDAQLRELSPEDHHEFIHFIMHRHGDIAASLLIMNFVLMYTTHVMSTEEKQDWANKLWAAMRADIMKEATRLTKIVNDVRFRLESKQLSEKQANAILKKEFEHMPITPRIILREIQNRRKLDGDNIV